MPLGVRYVEPKQICSKKLPRGVKNELQAVAVFSLAGAIRQVSSLALQAESVFGDIADILTSYHSRYEALGERARKIRDEVLPELQRKFVEDCGEDENVESIFKNPLPSKHFKSPQIKEQQILHIETAPASLHLQYQQATDKPALHLFSDLWPDKRNAIRMYSAPDFFFNNWRKAMEREARRMRTAKTISAADDFLESFEKKISSTIHYNKGRAPGRYDSSTLPTRGHDKRHHSPIVNAFNTLRRQEEKKKRKSIQEDTFVAPEKDHSESSGYTSQQSSFNSLSDQEGTSDSTHTLTDSNEQNGESALAQWSTSQPPSVANGSVRTVGLRAHRSYSYTGIRGGNSYSQQSGGFITDISTLHRHEYKTASPFLSDDKKRLKEKEEATAEEANTGGVRPPEIRPKRGPPPVKLVKPKRSYLRHQNGIGARSASVSCVATADDSSVNSQVTSAPPSHIFRSRPLHRNRPQSAIGYSFKDSLKENPGLEEELSREDKLTPLSPDFKKPHPLYRTSSGEESPRLEDITRDIVRHQKKVLSRTQTLPADTSPSHSSSSPKYVRPAPPAPSSSPRQPLARRESYSSSSSSSPGISRVRSLSQSSNEEHSPPIKRGSIAQFIRQSSAEKIKLSNANKSQSEEGRGWRRRSRKNSSIILKSSGVTGAELTPERNQLLAAIRRGIQLKKVQSKIEMDDTAMPWDVAAILERRRALEGSDNEYDYEGAVQDLEWEESQ